jgi:hypothetical protein
LLLPDAEDSMLLFSGFAELNPALEPYFADARAVGEVNAVRDDDFDRPLMVFSAETDPLLNTIDTRMTPTIASIGLAPNAELLGYELLTPEPAAGDVVQIATLWRALQPIDNVVLFTHILGADGVPVAQADRLDVPSAFWHPGDVFIQLHDIQLPGDLPGGDYPIAIGAYQRLAPDDLPRLSVTVNGATAGDLIPLTRLTISTNE